MWMSAYLRLHGGRQLSSRSFHVAQTPAGLCDLMSTAALKPWSFYFELIYFVKMFLKIVLR